jgi:hypothetical protein
MGAKSSSIVIVVTADFFFDCWAAEVPSDEWIRDEPGGVHNHAQDLRLESFQDFSVGGEAEIIIFGVKCYAGKYILHTSPVWLKESAERKMVPNFPFLIWILLNIFFL